MRLCVQYYFKFHFDDNIEHFIADAHFYILISLRILRTKTKNVKDAITFYVWKGAWYSHTECLWLFLLASSHSQDRHFSISQVKLREGAEYGNKSLRPRIAPKLNLSATSLTNLMSWKSWEMQDLSFTCSISSSDMKDSLDVPFVPLKFSYHTEMSVKLVAEAADAFFGDETKATTLHREEVPVFTTKKHFLTCHV